MIREGAKKEEGNYSGSVVVQWFGTPA